MDSKLLVTLGKVLDIVSHKKTNHKPCNISVVGCIGVGKTTIIDTLLVPLLKSNNYTVEVVKEPIEEWGSMLQLFYGDMRRWSYTFQTLTLVTRRAAWLNRSTADVTIVERGIDSDNIFATMLHDDGLMNDSEYKCYSYWWDMWTTTINYNIDIYLNVYCDTNISISRITTRCRDGETNGISANYQETLEKHHTNYLRVKDSVLNINSNLDASTYTEYITYKYPKVLTIDGSIAVGKTSSIPSYIKQFQDDQKTVAICEENVESWATELSVFYNTGKGAFELQKKIIETRASSFLKAYVSGCDVVIQERNIDSDFIFAEMLYESGHISPSQFTEYKRIHKLLSNAYCINGKIVYMKETPEICLQRIAKRGRCGEENISIEYLSKLIEKYNDKYE